MGIEDAEVVLAAVVGALGDFLEAAGGEPVVQQETQTVCPSKETGFLPGERGRPRWASTCFLNSSEEIERREDKISCIRSSLISGRTGVAVGRSVFTGHEDRAEPGS